ncbi:Primase [Kitasatospora sp. MMS16-BH015]|uniref:phage major capsid protein n=1 Tax=Kitasatospora sp. MMS16-BH015 TaxID=2018025 RepID=UPI000CA16F5F|nr:phage major capsid protein [Kitasatospora sp. MMS16-BH015]AUG78089.1 Primase [Kitasatospora sp. MMS16-BH015]
MSALITSLIERRGQIKADLDALLATPTAEARDLTQAEAETFNTTVAEIRGLDERIDELTEQAERDRKATETARKFAAAAEHRSPADLRVVEPQVYRSGAGGTSYFKDLFLATRKGDVGAADRLRRNDRMAAEIRAVSTTNGQGGEFVPPVWLEESFVRIVRPGRVTANLCVKGEIPAGTDSLTIPKMVTGTVVAPQVAQNTGVQQTDITTTSIAASVNTVAGGQTISMQLVEQSPLNIDDLILEDLANDYAQKLDAGQVLGGTGTGGTAMGLLNLAGTIPVTWTQATPALGGAGGLYSKVANAIQLITSTRFQTPTAIVMHPRRWWWAVSQSDAQGRPLVVPNAGHPINNMGTLDSLDAEGPVGSMLALPVYVDANMPTNLGAGNNQDAILVGRFRDFYLWEGDIRAETFQQTYAQNLSLFVRLYNYVAFQGARYLSATALITGTGAVNPTF